ncbi:hypothetical protein [Paenibacillus sp. 2TAB26]|uniref:hypothetical protein n=1 Tax=Paenibacillus sp. 2TAB26 TaxID=3233005 RepID=UPI003F9B2AE9
MWTSKANGASAVSHHTIENNWRAAAVAFFGGGHKSTNNAISDTVDGNGIRMNTVFPDYPLSEQYWHSLTGYDY